MNLFLLASCLIIGAVRGQDMMRPQETGSEVVESVVEQVRASCVYPQDNMFLRRLAYVESHDGTDPDTFRHGFYGGIWQVTQAMYEQTKTSSYLQTLRNDIQSHLGIDWSRTTYQDLLKPLYSGLAAALYIRDTLRDNAHPTTLGEQQYFWQNNYHRGSIGSGQTYMELVQLMTPGCQSQSNLDLAFILDTSSSISSADFEAAKRFIIDILAAAPFDVDSGRTRVALITYATQATIRISWDEFRSKTLLDNAIRSLSYETGGTETAEALNKAREELFSRARSNAVKVLVLVTDGQSHDTIDTNNAANLLHSSGDILVLAVGVSDMVDQNELQAIASDPPCKHTFRVASYDQINALREEIEQITCKAPLILNINETVTCSMCHCSPYAVPMITSPKVAIDARTTCSGSVTVYTSYTNGYPTSDGRSPPFLTFSRSHPNSTVVSPPSSSNSYYYVNIDQSRSELCGTGCTVTLHPHISDVRVVCFENGVERSCTNEDIRLYAPHLLQP